MVKFGGIKNLTKRFVRLFTLGKIRFFGKPKMGFLWHEKNPFGTLRVCLNCFGFFCVVFFFFWKAIEIK